MSPRSLTDLQSTDKESADNGRNAHGQFTDGNRGGPGRPRGTPNAISRDMKEMMFTALDRAGGEDYIFRFAQEHPERFMQIMGRMLPTSAAATMELEVSRCVELPLTEEEKIELARSRIIMMICEIHDLGIRPEQVGRELLARGLIAMDEQSVEGESVVAS